MTPKTRKRRRAEKLARWAKRPRPWRITRTFGNLARAFKRSAKATRRAVRRMEQLCAALGALK